jgi:hypothetical protein
MLSDHTTFQSGELIILTKKPNADASLFSGVSAGNIDIGTSLNGVINVGSTLSTIHLVGETTATTQPSTDDSNKVATTAFVKAQGSSGNLLNQVNTFSQEQVFQDKIVTNVGLTSDTFEDTLKPLYIGRQNTNEIFMGKTSKYLQIDSLRVNIGNSLPQTARMAITCHTLGERDGISIKSQYTNDMWYVIFVNQNGDTIGQIANIGWSVRYNSNSDRRLKEEIQPMDSSLSKLMQLKPSKFKWKADPNKKQDYGFIAQDVFQVFPHFQSLEGENPQKDGKDVYHGLDYGLFTPHIIKGIQELKMGYDAKIASLEARLLRLETR